MRSRDRWVITTVGFYIAIILLFIFILPLINGLINGSNSYFGFFPFFIFFPFIFRSRRHQRNSSTDSETEPNSEEGLMYPEEDRGKWVAFALIVAAVAATIVLAYVLHLL